MHKQMAGKHGTQRFHGSTQRRPNGLVIRPGGLARLGPLSECRLPLKVVLPPAGLAEGSGEGLQPFDDLGLGLDAEGFVLQLAILEEKQGWDIADAVFDGEIGLFIHVDFYDLDGAAFFSGDFIEDRAQHLAGAAPLCPEIDHHGNGGLQDIRSEGGFGSLGDGGGSPKIWEWGWV